MKKFLRIFIPLLLIAALLAGAFWYFFLYQPSITADFLVDQASFFARHEHYRISMLLYSWSDRLAPSDREAHALEIADTYEDSGNPTKAEYILVRAISADGESTALYTELSSVYISEDKLLDASTLLDRIADDEIREELNALRPESPTLSPESGSYSEAITIEILGHGAAVYATADGSFPSAATDGYLSPITLSEEGSYTVQAISVSSEGLVSRVVSVDYTIGNLVTPVTFTDAAIESTVRQLLGISDSRQLLSSDLWSITSFTVPAEAKSVEDLALLTGLTSLTCDNCSCFDAQYLAGLSELQILSLNGSSVSREDLSIIGTLSGLRELYLSGCFLTDIDALSDLTGLQILDLSDNVLQSIDALGSLTSLIQLSLADNTLSDVGELSMLTEMESLNISGNDISDISCLQYCSQIWTLNFSDCSVSTLAPLAGLTGLEELFLADNRVSDLSPLADCTALRILDISGNRLTDISLISSFTALEEVYCGSNEITEIPDMSGCRSLHVFSAAENSIADGSGLSGLEQLNTIDLTDNLISDTSCFSSCYNLVRLNIWGCPVLADNVQPLIDAGVLVDYDPTWQPASAEEDAEAAADTDS